MPARSRRTRRGPIRAAMSSRAPSAPSRRRWSLRRSPTAFRSSDRFLLCSDGLCKTLAEAELGALLAAPEDASPAELLVAAALAREAGDNVTAVVVEVA